MPTGAAGAWTTAALLPALAVVIAVKDGVDPDFERVLYMFV